MKVSGNHPLAEVIAKQLSGIESVPKEYQKKMVNRTAKKAVEFHEANKFIGLQKKCDELYDLVKDKKETTNDVYSILKSFENKK